MPIDPPIQRRTRDLIRTLDPRLALLHWRDETAANALRSAEREQLAAIETRLNATFPTGLDADALDQQTTDRAKQVRALLFSPFTTGILPAPAPDYARATGSNATETILSVLILGDIGAHDLRALGCVPRSKVGDVFTAWVPWSRLTALAGAAGVQCVDLARAFKPSLGTAIPATGIDVLHAAGHKGAGVIVGIVDQVLDFHHLTFRQGSSSRVLFLWDQTLLPTGGERSPPAIASGSGGNFALTGLDYGVEYPQAVITQQVAAFEANPSSPPYDLVRHKPPKNAGPLNAHGTFVAGIAAGSGGGGTSPLPGAAPASDIVFVHFKSESDDLPLAESTHVLHAFEYIFKWASALNKACAINFSYNDAQGSHDGKSLVETALDTHLDLSVGRAITVSAGNDNQAAWHAADTLVAKNGAFELELPLLITGGSKVPEEAQVWFRGSRAFQFALDVQPTGKPRETWIDWTDVDKLLDAFAPGFHTSAVVATVLADPRNGDSMVEFVLVPETGKAIQKGTYFLRLKSDAALDVDAWVSAANVGTKWTASVENDELTIGLPATGDCVIAVGEHKNVSANRTLLPTSGCGPARDNDKQPWLAAPGALFAPKPTNRLQYKAPSLFYSNFSGTSASAPLVAGTCALMFDCLGADTPWSVLRETLKGDAVQPTTSTWDNGWGYGYLKASGLCARATAAAAAPTVNYVFVPRTLSQPVPRSQERMTPISSEVGAFTSELSVTGSGSRDVLEIRARRGLSIEIELPLACLPWRDREALEALRRAGEKRLPFSTTSTRDPLAAVDRTLNAEEARERLDVQGVEHAVIKDGRVRLRSAPGGRILLESLRIARGEKAPMRVSIRNAQGVTEGNLARVAQLVKGVWKSCIMLMPGTGQ